MAQGKRIVFMGTSAFAARILKALHEAGYEIAGVYAQPDRPAGRGLKDREPEVKRLARELGLPVYQPRNFKSDADVAALADLRPDFLVVASYGLILPQRVLDIPAISPVNVHASLLPRYRGAAPIQRAIMENWHPDAATGVSIMRMDKGMDTGPVYAEAETPIAGQNAEELTETLADIGAGLLLEALPQIAAGALLPKEQHGQATLAPKLNKEDAIIDWRQTAARVDAQIRGVYVWPGAHAVMKIGEQAIPISIRKGKIGEKAENAAPGVIRYGKNRLAIACGDYWYELLRIRPQGRQEMTGAAFANGLHAAYGDIGMAE